MERYARTHGLMLVLILILILLLLLLLLLAQRSQVDRCSYKMLGIEAHTQRPSCLILLLLHHHHLSIYPRKFCEHFADITPFASIAPSAVHAPDSTIERSSI